MIHYICNGVKKYLYIISCLKWKSEYKVDDDWQQMNGTALFSIKLKKDMLLLLEPNDAHKKQAYWLKNQLILRKLFLR